MPNAEGRATPHPAPTSTPIDSADYTAPPLAVPAIDAEEDTLGAALEYAAHGWYILPAKRGTKHPGSVVGTNWPAKSSRDARQLAAWFAGTDHLIALHCGRSGAVAFDVDRPDQLPEVLRRHLHAAVYQNTRPEEPGRGHYLFRQPPGRVLGNGGGRLGRGWGEIRGCNGVIVAAPAGERRWIRTGTLPALPAEVAELLPDGKPGDAAASDAAVAAFLAAHTAASAPELLLGPVRTLQDKIADGDSRHASGVSAYAWAMGEAAAGFYSAADADAALREVLVNAFGAQRAPSDRVLSAELARLECDGMLAWAVGQAAALSPDQLDAIRARVKAKLGAEEQAHTPKTPIPIEQAHKVFQRWLGDDYDTDALDVMLSAAAVERFEDGSDPLWLLIISGPGNAKTETVQSLDGIAAIVTSALSSEAALLSATAKKERAKNATGGLLRRIGTRGVLAIKDVTSILSMNRDLRAKLLAALREVYDGRWDREVGAEGGQVLTWKGRIAVVGAVTTAWDAHHAVVSSMGDRFVLIRMDSTTGRVRAGRQAIGNTGSEPVMRAELAEAVAGVLAGMSPETVQISDAETDVLLAAADLVTLARTGVEYDYRGDVIDAHAPEMPTRFAKQLAQIIRGAAALGIERPEAVRLAIRCARDSMPPLRLAIINDLAEHPHSTTAGVRLRVDKPRATVDRQLQALHTLGIVAVDEQETPSGRSKWFYSLAAGIDPSVLKLLPEKSLTTPNPHRKEEDEERLVPKGSTDLSGNCGVCGQALMHPDSIARGYCERCRLLKHRGGAA
jgi:hypothetical protein